MPNLKTVMMAFLLMFSFLFTACFDGLEESKGVLKTLLKGEPSEKNYEFSQQYFEEGKYEEALKFDIKQLEEDLKYYKDESAEIALDYNNIGLDYDELKNYKKALEYYIKAMKIDDITLESNSTERSTTYYNAAASFGALKRYDEALNYYFKALKIDNVGLGHYHDDVLAEYEEIAVIYEKTNKVKLAIEFLEKALELKEHVYGNEDERTYETRLKIKELEKKMN